MSALEQLTRDSAPAPFLLRAPGSGVLVILVAVVALYFPSFAWLVGEWATTVGDFSHGFLVAGISAWLLLRALPKIERPENLFNGIGLLALAATSFVWILSRVASVAQLESAMLPLILLSALYMSFGKQVIAKLGFPILYLYFAMPIWAQLVPLFQQLTIEVVHLMVRAVDITVYVQGDLVHLPHGSFEVAGGCSGLSFILTGTAIAALYGFLSYRRTSARLKLFVVAFALSVILNWIRVFLIVVVGNAYRMNHILVEDHLTFGWVLFVLMLVPLFLVASRLDDSDEEATSVIQGHQEAAKEVAVSRLNVAILSTLLSVALVAAAPAWAAVIESRKVEVDNFALSCPFRRPAGRVHI